MFQFPEILTVWSFLALIALFIIFGLLTATIEMMFQHFMMPNNILYPYAILLSWIAGKGEVWRHLMRPFGRCRYCNGIWITIYAYIYIFGFNIFIIFPLSINFLGVWLYTNKIMPDFDPAEMADKRLGIHHKLPTPWQDMLKTYIIMGFGYAVIYGIIPLIV